MAKTGQNTLPYESNETSEVQATIKSNVYNVFMKEPYLSGESNG